jgi:catalase (peroxidase I)
MNVQETIALIDALKSAGTTHFKSNDFEISMDGRGAPVGEKPVQDVPVPQAAHVQENAEATQKLKDLIGTLNLSNEELIDKIFPAGAGG